MRPRQRPDSASGNPYFDIRTGQRYRRISLVALHKSVDTVLNGDRPFEVRLTTSQDKWVQSQWRDWTDKKDLISFFETCIKNPTMPLDMTYLWHHLTYWSGGRVLLVWPPDERWFL